MSLATISNAQFNGEDQIIGGFIAEDAETPNDSIHILLPSYDMGRQFGPVTFTPRPLLDGSVLLPSRNDPCVVALDEDDNAVLISWWAQDPTDKKQSVKHLMDYWNASMADYTLAFINAFSDLDLAGGGTLQLPENKELLLSDQVQPPSNTTVLGSRTTVIKAANGTSITLFVSTSKTNVHIKGFTINGNKANVAGGNGVVYNLCSDSTVEDLVIIDPYNDGIILDAVGSLGCSRCDVRNVKVFNAGSHGIALSGTAGFGYAGGAQWCEITDCYVENPGTSGINCSQSARCRIVDNAVKSNTVIVSGWPGIRMSNGSSYNLVDGNIVYGTSRGYLIAADAGVGDGPPQYNVYGVNRAENCLQHGFLCEAPNNDLGDLKITDCAQDSAYQASDGSALRINNASWCKVGGNTSVVDTTATKHRTSILISGTSDFCSVGDGVIIRGFVTQPISITGINTFVGRIIYDPADPLAVNSRNAAASLSLRDWYDEVTINGTLDVNSISSLRKRVVRFRFTGTAAANGFVDGNNLKMAGNFVYSPDDMLVMYCDGVNYYEMSRSPN